MLIEWRYFRCTRCCLHNSLRVVNMLVNLIGVGMIIYSLWLLKKWNDGVSQLAPSSISNLPRPWFIYVCLGVGMMVSLSTICGHMVANCITNSVLCTYIVSISSIILLQTGVFIAIFFKMDLLEEITEYIDDQHLEFRQFIIFHLYMCKMVTIMVLVAQVSVVTVATVLWVVGKERVTSHCNLLGPIGPTEIDHFRYSFLIPDHPPVSSPLLVTTTDSDGALTTTTTTTTITTTTTTKLNDLLLNTTSNV